MTHETVSVVVPSFNRSRYLGECLESLLAQTVPPLEVIVVDDGSTDDTAEVVASFGCSVRYLRKKNGGKSSAVNLGLAVCSGSLVWIFDDDDIALPRAIEQRLATLARNPDAGFVYSSHYVGFSGANGQIVSGSLSEPEPVDDSNAFLLTLLSGCFFHLNTCLVRRELLDKVGLFDTSLKAGEDYDMQIRLAFHGQPAYCKEPSFLFRQHDGARGDSNLRFAASERSRVFRRYSKMLGEKTRQWLPLGHFVVPRSEALPEGERRAAFLNRALSMANFGCWREMLEDLNEAAMVKVAASSLTPSERELVCRMMGTGWAYEAAADEWSAFCAHARILRNQAGGAAFTRALAAGIWRTALGWPGTVRVRAERALHALRLVV